MLNTEQKKEIVSKFRSKVPNYKCPICQSKVYKFMDGYILMPLESSIVKQTNPDKCLPCIAVACEQCGHVSFFNTLNLDLSEE